MYMSKEMPVGSLTLEMMSHKCGHKGEGGSSLFPFGQYSSYHHIHRGKDIVSYGNNLHSLEPLVS
jgi:hypothetical protein